MRQNYIRLFTPKAPLLGISMCMWTKPSQSEARNWRYFFSTSTREQDNLFSLGATDDETCVMDIHNVELKGVPCRIMDGEWHHYCMIWNGEYATLTEDGMLLGAPTSTVAPAPHSHPQVNLLFGIEPEVSSNLQYGGTTDKRYLTDGAKTTGGPPGQPGGADAEYWHSDNDLGRGPWAKVTFLQKSVVSRAQVVNRCDGCCADRLDGATVFIGQEDGQEVPCGAPIGRTGACGEAIVECDQPITGVYAILRGEPVGHSLNVVEFEVYGVPISNLPPVVVVNMPENKRSYSSVWNNDRPGSGHGRSMLDSEAWSAGRTGDWMKMDLGRVLRVGGVVTQSRAAANCCGTQRVTRFQIMTSEDDATYD